MARIVESLPASQRLALDRYYSEGLHAEQAVLGTGLTVDEFRVLRGSVRARYQATVGNLGPTPQESSERQQHMAARLAGIRQRRQGGAT
jgi:hypothetical protein